MVLSGALNDKKPVSSLFQKDVCSVFIFHLGEKEKKKSGCPSPNMVLRAGKRKGEYTFSTCLDSVKSVCKPAVRQNLQLLTSLFIIYLSLHIFIYIQKMTGKGRSMTVGTCDSILVKKQYNIQFLSAHLKMLTISRQKLNNNPPHTLSLLYQPLSFSKIWRKQMDFTVCLKKQVQDICGKF